MALPTNVDYGTVVGRLVRAVIDGDDADRNPDMAAITNVRVVFSASVSRVVNRGAQPAPVMIFLDPIRCTLDEEGYLIGEDGQPGVRLVATDDPDLDPNGWTYRVTVSGDSIPTLSWNIDVPMNAVVDLSTAMPVPSNPGGAVAEWRAVVDTVMAARDEVLAAIGGASGVFMPQRVDGAGAGAGRFRGVFTSEPTTLPGLQTGDWIIVTGS